MSFPVCKDCWPVDIDDASKGIELCQLHTTTEDLLAVVRDVHAPPDLAAESMKGFIVWFVRLCDAANQAVAKVDRRQSGGSQ